MSAVEAETIRVKLGNKTTELPRLQALSYLSRGLATEAAPRRAKKSASEATGDDSGHSDTPEPSQGAEDPMEALPGAATGQDADTAENKPPASG